mmetsp:Transcript_32908/g.55148  ORF Transcript_32908/g.55148 Transcript_32908/m.55148 type:complete len:83 (+) Transcript_32908:155-403(+)
MGKANTLDSSWEVKRNSLLVIHSHVVNRHDDQPLFDVRPASNSMCLLYVRLIRAFQEKRKCQTYAFDFQSRQTLKSVWKKET